MATNLTRTTFTTTYKDDFSDSDNFHRILFNSGRVVQARELTQAQTILQKQIERFGNNIFQEGAMVKAGGVTINNSYEFVKLNTNNNALPTDTSTLVGTEFTSTGSDGIKFEVLQVVAAVSGDEANNPATLYVRYTYTKDATAGEGTLRAPDDTNITNGSVTLTTAGSNATGVGIVVNIQNGIFYAKGHFVFTEDQSLIVSKYSDVFTGDIGFKVTEDVVTSDDDNSLFDNQGAVPNIASPGADRYGIRLSLIDKTDIAGTENFVFLAKLQDGGVVKTVNEVNSFNVPNQVIAKRIKENSGDYLIKQFKSKFEVDSANTHLLLKVSDGVAVIDGFRVERGPSSIRVQKSLSTFSETGQAVPASFGNFVKVNSSQGNTKGLPDISTFESLDIQDSANFAGGSSGKLGTTRVRAVSEDGANFKYHIFDTVMNSGKNFRDAKSIGSDSNNHFNIILDNNQAVIQEPEKNNLLFELPNNTPSSLSSITLVEQKRVTRSVSAKNGTLVALGNGETYTNQGDWIFAKDDSDVFIGSRTITFSGTPSVNHAASFTLDSAANGTYEILHYISKTATIREKNLTSANSGQIDTSVSTNIDSDGNGLLSLGLGKADIFDIVTIKDSALGLEDYSSRFILDNGQRDNFYTEGRLILKGGQSMPADGVYSTFRHFTHTSGDFFAISSYDSAALGGYKNIPSHILADGTSISLADFLDFRSVKNSSNGTFSGGDAIVNEIPQPNDLINFTGSYYLQQSGKIVLSNEGILEFVRGDGGAPANTFPPAPVGTMGLYDVILGANTLHDSDLLMQPIDHKRFTMKDIARLEKRIDRLEEATTLTLLELDTKNFEVLDSSGLNRTRSGFFVDNFENQLLSATDNEDYAASLDPFASFLHPAFNEDNVRLIWDSSNSTNIVKRGDNLYIDYDSADFLDASKASTSVTVNPFNFTQFKGTLKLSPSSDEWRDTETRTGKIVDGGIQLDTKQAYLWNNHEWNWGGKELEDLKVGSRTNNSKNSIFNKVVTDEKIREVIGTKVLDVALIPFMRQKKIYFKAEALRPNTRHFAYFDEKLVSPASLSASFVREETFKRYADDQTDYGNTQKNITAHPEGASILVSDSDGMIEGSFFMAAQTFKTGTKEFVLLDLSKFNKDNAQSSATAAFTSSGLIETVEETVKSTRVLTLKQQKIAPKPKPRVSNNRRDKKDRDRSVYVRSGKRMIKIRNSSGHLTAAGRAKRITDRIRRAKRWD